MLNSKANPLTTRALEVLKGQLPYGDQERELMYNSLGFVLGQIAKGDAYLILSDYDQWGKERSRWGACRIEGLNECLANEFYRQEGVPEHNKAHQIVCGDLSRCLAKRLTKSGFQNMPVTEYGAYFVNMAGKSCYDFLKALKAPDECIPAMRRSMSGKPVWAPYRSQVEAPEGYPEKRWANIPTFDENGLYNSPVYHSQTFYYRLKKMGCEKTVAEAKHFGGECIQRLSCRNTLVPCDDVLLAFAVYATLGTDAFTFWEKQFKEDIEMLTSLHRKAGELQATLTQEHPLSLDECDKVWHINPNFEGNDKWTACRDCNSSLGKNNLVIKGQRYAKRNGTAYAVAILIKVLRGLWKTTNGNDGYMRAFRYYCPKLYKFFRLHFLEAFVETFGAKDFC